MSRYIIIGDELEIKTKLLFDMYDEGRDIVFKTSNGNFLVSRLTYSYKSKKPLSYFFTNLDEYQVAVFEDLPQTELTAWEEKLLSMYHIEWCNVLFNSQISSIFVALLKTYTKLNLSKSLLFNIFQHPIKDTILPFDIDHGELLLNTINKYNHVIRRS